MLSKIQYDILKRCQGDGAFAEPGIESEYVLLTTHRYLISEAKVIGGTVFTNYRTSQLGLRAIEEYEQFTEYNSRLLELSEKEEQHSKRANQIAEDANKKSTHANIISWVAVGISVASILAAVLIGVYC